jgi:HEAT repeat protein/protein-S-isoprenylcysteine O-methyltransferase Ste14
MKTKFVYGFLLTLLAIIFTIGLTFASLELPRLLDSFLHRNVDFLDVATGSGAESDYKTELYLGHYHLRLIGYCCLALIIILIAVGFITGKSGLSSAGAVFLFLPVFGHFALTMFFLGGLGFMRLIWMPFLDVSFDVLRLGDIVYLPYRMFLDLSSLVGVSIRRELPYVITGIGLLLFMLGTLAWLYSKVQKKRVADFWVYRISRHPQYLGWIVWSYGIMFMPGPNMKRSSEISNSLPWLLMSMTIIGVAMLEELKMSRERGEEYESYYRRTPFLMPLPRFVSKIFSIPLWLFYRKWRPERKREIVVVIAFYTVLCIVLSAFYGGLIPLPEKSRTNVEQRIEKLVKVVKDTRNRNDMRKAARELADIGEPAIEALIGLLGDDNLYVRWYTADALGSVKSEKVVQPLIELLYDEDKNVRRVAAGSLRRTGAEEAVQPLIEALQDQTRGISIAAARALGQIGAQESVPPLIEALQGTNTGTAGAAAEALGEIGTQEAVGPLTRCLEEMENCPHNQVGWALWRLGSERAVDAFAAGLEEGTWWQRSSNASALGEIRSEKAIEPLTEALRDESERVRRAAVLALMEIESEKAVDALAGALRDEDFEVRMYAEEALKRIGEPDASEAKTIEAK